MNMKMIGDAYLRFQVWFNKKFGWFFMNGYKSSQREGSKLPNL